MRQNKFLRIHSKIIIKITLILLTKVKILLIMIMIFSLIYLEVIVIIMIIMKLKHIFNNPQLQLKLILYNGGRQMNQFIYDLQIWLGIILQSQESKHSC
ncbi:hypothetical protein RhiirC2_302892 [Rhizophagus irregularis]|uniref:Transmembrane protein n=1 Tax=Rhizophagus irregularis TaxID=588596 RepID=A0A2N1MC49_9GLOM|nr:hypothetical protein RhiirC2_302892 [Rhizophagus irregularis]